MNRSVQCSISVSMDAIRMVHCSEKVCYVATNQFDGGTIHKKYRETHRFSFPLIMLQHNRQQPEQQLVARNKSEIIAKQKRSELSRKIFAAIEIDKCRHKSNLFKLSPFILEKL